MRARSNAKRPSAATETPEPASVRSEPKDPKPSEVSHCNRAPLAVVDIPEAYLPIVSTVFSIESPETTYEQIEAAIRPIRASRADYGTIVDALDRSQEIARLSMQLLVNAKVEADAFERDSYAVLSGLRDAATAALEEEKEQGTRKKAITEADVTSRMASVFPDDWREIENRRVKVKRMISYLEDLTERARERSRDLRSMIMKSRD